MVTLLFVLWSKLSYSSFLVVLPPFLPWFAAANLSSIALVVVGVNEPSSFIIAPPEEETLCDKKNKN